MTYLQDPAFFAIATTLVIAAIRYFRPDVWMMVPERARSIPQLVIAAFIVGGAQGYRELTGIGLEAQQLVRESVQLLLLTWLGSIGVYEAQKTTFPTAMQRLRKRRPAIPREEG